jgi:hypothetical protein
MLITATMIVFGVEGISGHLAVQPDGGGIPY